ncbi:MAG: mechanosensitive ion channel family protein [Rickettsiales bacterium]|nr:mechanosensitive ion channel family protein [Rickettsiales bacterium]
MIKNFSFTFFEYFYKRKRVFFTSLIIAAKKPLLSLIWICLALKFSNILTMHLANINVAKLINSVFYLVILILLLKIATRFKKQYILQKTKKINISGLDFTEKLVKIMLFVIWLFLILGNFGININTLLAFGGFGSVIVGLAGKDIFSNIFSGIVIYIDKPFSVGDEIVLEEKKITGKVEYISWRQTKILLKETNIPMYIPNSIFSITTIQNKNKTSYFKIDEKILLKYQDFDKMEQITKEITSTLKSCYGINKSTVSVFFTGITNNCLTLRIAAMTNTNSLQKLSTIKQDILIKSIKIVKENGVVEIPEFNVVS